MEAVICISFDFKDFRDTLDLEKAYLQGRFDAIPYYFDSNTLVYMKKFLFIFLSSLLFQQIIAQTIVKFGNGKNLKYKDLQGKTVIKNKEYIIAFTDSISSIGFVGTKKG